jgi:tRNA(Ile)-lysidine synthase
MLSKLVQTATGLFFEGPQMQGRLNELAEKSPSLPEALAASWPVEQWREVTVVVAVSGGPDSVALLRAMHSLKTQAGGPGQLIVAHFNHHLRPEADADQEFVSDLAARLDFSKISFEHIDSVEPIDVVSLAKLRGDGVEAAAREARYEFFQRTAERRGARYVVTGHTADDQVETVLFNILRGTGLAGLAGMQRARMLGPAVSLIRPLLNVRRAEVLRYLNEIGQPYRIDSTNASIDFTRNRIRHELLPQLRENYNCDLETALTQLSQLAADAQKLIEQLAEELLNHCTSPGVATPGLGIAIQHCHTITIMTDSLAETDRHLVREMFVALWRRMNWPLQNMGFSQWNALADMAQSTCEKAKAGQKHFPKRVFPGGIVVQRCDKVLHLSDDRKSTSGNIERTLGKPSG